VLLPVRASKPAAQTRSHDPSLFFIKLALHLHELMLVAEEGEIDCV
jgi:hypothetical protein